MDFIPRHVFRLLKKDKRKDFNVENPRGLPTELLLHIISFLYESEGALLKLSSSCKVLYLLIKADFYKSIHVGINDDYPTSTNLNDVRFQSLCRTLVAKDMAPIITELKIHLGPCPSLPGQRPSLWQARSCKAVKIDQLIGKMIPSLHNLQTFHFQCRACPRAVYYTDARKPCPQRHSYMENLTNKSLREVVFNCTCQDTPRPFEPFKFLFAPFMQSVTSLSWKPCEMEMQDHQIWADLIEKVRSDDRIHATKIEKLETNYPPIALRFLVEENLSTLTHLVCEDLDKELHDILSKSPRGIESLHCTLGTFSPYIIQEPTAYINLRHLGVHDLTDFDSSTRTSPLVHSHLPNLESVHLSLSDDNTHAGESNWYIMQHKEYPFANHLAKWFCEFPTLKKVYVDRRQSLYPKYRVWTSRAVGAPWEVQRLEDLVVWDIITGRI